MIRSIVKMETKKKEMSNIVNNEIQETEKIETDIIVDSVFTCREMDALINLCREKKNEINLRADTISKHLFDEGNQTRAEEFRVYAERYGVIIDKLRGIREVLGV